MTRAAVEAKPHPRARRGAEGRNLGCHRLPGLIASAYCMIWLSPRTRGSDALRPKLRDHVGAIPAHARIGPASARWAK